MTPMRDTARRLQIASAVPLPEELAPATSPPPAPPAPPSSPTTTPASPEAAIMRVIQSIANAYAESEIPTARRRALMRDELLTSADAYLSAKLIEAMRRRKREQERERERKDGQTEGGDPMRKT